MAMTCDEALQTNGFGNSEEKVVAALYQTGLNCSQLEQPEQEDCRSALVYAQECHEEPRARSIHKLATRDLAL